MNVRLSQGQLRVRVSKEEASAALANGIISEEFKLPNGTVFSCTVSAVSTPESLFVSLTEGGISCTVSREAFSALLKSGPSKEAVLTHEATPDFSCIVEIDLFSFKEKRR